MISKIFSAIVATTLAVLSISQAQAGSTLDAVKARGVVLCGVSPGGLAGFSLIDSTGKYTGIDVDLCKAIAAVLFGDPDKVKYVPLTAQQRFTALQSGEIDVLSHNTTWTMQRDTALGLNFAGVDYYDGQGFMVAKKLNVKSAKELNGATVCVQPGTTTELNLADFARSNKIDLKPVVIEKLEEIESAFLSGRCDAYTADISGLASTRAAKASNPDDYIILPEVISKEPLGPAVRHGDDQWLDVVRWTLYALVEAEEYGVTQANLEDMKKSDNPGIKRLLGVTPGLGKAMGVDEAWAYNAIKAVGNYGEMFERNLGTGSKLKLARGLNALWTKGGIQYAMPVR